MDDYIKRYVREPRFKKGAWIEGKELRIYRDDDPNGWNPRTDFDNFGHMLCFHKRYDLGDIMDLKSEDFASWDEVRQYLAQVEGASIILPLYLIDHSGLSMRTYSFSDCDPGCWDSGQVGFIYCTLKDIKDCFMLKDAEEITPEILETSRKNLEAEVEEYDKYLTGEVYGYILFENGEEIDSCWGFYGGIEQILEETGMENADEID